MRVIPVAVLVAPSGLWRAWALEPGVLLGLALAALLYARGLRSLAARGRQPVRPRHVAAFLAGLLCLAAALLSPLDTLAGTLLSAHMLQHLILMVGSPPLIVYGRPGVVLPMGLPGTLQRSLRDVQRARPLRALVRVSRSPYLALAAGTGALWLWHVPSIYDAALAHFSLHAGEHLCFVLSGLAFWRLVINPGGRRWLGYGGGILLSFVTMLQSAALGALITLSATSLYPAYRAGAALWGTTALADQQLAGALMWIPPGGLYLVTILVLAGRWFAQIEGAMRRKEAARPASSGAPAGSPPVVLAGASQPRTGMAPEGSP